MSETIFLEPVDGWSFRDGKPFEAGEVSDAGTIFPPSPWSTAGCIRTALLRKHCPNIEKYAGCMMEKACPECGNGPCAAIPIVGAPGEPPPFSIGPPLLARRNAPDLLEIFYPTPGDLVVEEVGKHNSDEIRLMKPLHLPPGVSCSLRNVLPVGVRAAGRIKPYYSEDLKTDYLDTKQLSEYLDGKMPTSIGSRPSWYREPRIGVGIDPIHSVLSNCAQAAQRFTSTMPLIEDIFHRHDNIFESREIPVVSSQPPR
jgi:hypothetical protein